MTSSSSFSSFWFLPETTITVTPVRIDHHDDSSRWHVTIRTTQPSPFLPTTTGRWLLQVSSQAHTTQTIPTTKYNTYHHFNHPFHRHDDVFASLRPQPGVVWAHAGPCGDGEDCLGNATAFVQQLPHWAWQHRLLLSSIEVNNPKLHRYPQQQKVVVVVERQDNQDTNPRNNHPNTNLSFRLEYLVLPSEGSAAISAEAWGNDYSEWWLKSSTSHLQRWMEWNETTQIQGWQYQIQLWSNNNKNNNKNPSLSELLPRSLWNPTTNPATRRRRPIRVQLLSSGNSTFSIDNRIRWNPNHACVRMNPTECRLAPLHNNNINNSNKETAWNQSLLDWPYPEEPTTTQNNTQNTQNKNTRQISVGYHWYPYPHDALVTVVDLFHDDEDQSCSDQASTVTVYQHIPPILKPQWTSLTFAILSLENHYDVTVLPVHEILQSLEFRSDGTHLVYQYCNTTGIRFNQTTSSRLQMSLSFEPHFWSLDVIPGDPNRGVELPPLQVSYHHEYHHNTTTATKWLASNTVLYLPPLPDLSMPFNVLSLTCTLYAFVIGSTMSWLVRKASQSIHKDWEGSPTHKPKTNPEPFSRLARVQAWMRKQYHQLPFRNTTAEASSKPDESLPNKDDPHSKPYEGTEEKATEKED